MARPAPRDDVYPPTFAKQFVGANGSADADLTAQFTQAPWSATGVLVTNSNATTMKNMVVRMQSDATTDVTIAVAGLSSVYVRGAFVTYRQTSDTEINATFFWSGGAT